MVSHVFRLRESLPRISQPVDLFRENLVKGDPEPRSTTGPANGNLTVSLPSGRHTMSLAERFPSLYRIPDNLLFELQLFVN